MQHTSGVEMRTEKHRRGEVKTEGDILEEVRTKENRRGNDYRGRQDKRREKKDTIEMNDGRDDNKSAKDKMEKRKQH